MHLTFVPINRLAAFYYLDDYLDLLMRKAVVYWWSHASCFGATPSVLQEAIRSRNAAVQRLRSSPVV